MDTVRDTLARCFALTFPDLDPSKYASATTENTPGWDSMAQVTLLTLIGEEFNLDVDFEAFEGATSFNALADRIQQMTAHA